MSKAHLLLIATGCRLAASVLAGALVIDSQQAPTFRIAGHVTRHVGNRPVSGARVLISMVEHPDQQVSCVTGETGSFSFLGLPPAKYSLQVNDHGWSQLFEQLDGYSTAIAVGPGLDSEHIVFPLDSPASIAGSVLDEDGDPVRGATLYLFARSVFNGVFRTQLNSQANTSAAGTFHFAHLAPGTYYVAVVGHPWYAQHLLSTQLGVQQDQAVPRSELDVAYPLTYYAGVTTPDAATPLELQEGARAEIQFSLQAVPALHIAIESVGNQPNQQIQTSLSQAGPRGPLINIPTWSSGSELAGFPPGNYILSASVSGQDQQPATGSQEVSLERDSTVHLSDLVKTSVSGKVLLDGDIPAGLAIWLGDVSNGTVASALVAHDGSFDVTQVPPGRYALLLADTPDLYMRAVTVKGGVYQNGELNVAKGAQIGLTIDAGRGLIQVKGAIVNGKKPVSCAMVLLVPRDFSHGRYIPRDQSDSDGTFTLNWAAPGRYTLLAIDNGRGLAYAEPASLALYLPHGQVVDLPLPKDAALEIQVQPRR